MTMTLLERRLARCMCALRIEPHGVRAAKRTRYRRGYGSQLTRNPRWAPQLRLWDPAGEHFHLPHGSWLNVEDFFMSDALPRPADCHHYCEVEVGQACHKCKRKVRGVSSGIACPCEHTWYCA